MKVKDPFRSVPFRAVPRRIWAFLAVCVFAATTIALADPLLVASTKATVKGWFTGDAPQFEEAECGCQVE